MAEKRARSKLAEELQGTDIGDEITFTADISPTPFSGELRQIRHSAGEVIVMVLLTEEQKGDLPDRYVEKTGDIAATGDLAYPYELECRVTHTSEVVLTTTSW
ncbi:hypothetical protein [Rhodococcus sp. BS-15]|uniref:hypothetical protein n=1 Tax=Rhodococcus sp. BS-15 TaxID=1304954 RepID=UPI000B0554B6|nr:hypothetical protein [Rhodococcus sp. BS-15]